jgi:hypothetical protein
MPYQQLPPVLPIPVNYQDKTFRRFSLRRINVGDLKRINDPTVRGNKPFTWIANTLSIILDSIDDEKINSYYEAQLRIGSSTVWHPLLMTLPASDALYILIAGHWAAYKSPLIQNLESRCGGCGNKYTYSIDLSNVEFPQDWKEDLDNVLYTVQLPDGFVHNSPNRDLGIEGTVWNTYVFRIPRLGDLLHSENRLGLTANSDFIEYLLFRTLEDVRSKDTFLSMGREIINSFNTRLITELSPPDLIAINKFYSSKIPDVHCRQIVNCKKCGNEMEVDLDTNFLFPMMQ